MKRLKALLISISLLIASQAHAGVPVIDGARVSTDAAGWLAQAQEYGKELLRWEEQLRQYADKFKQAAAGNFSGILTAMGINGDLIIKTDAQRKAAHDKAVSDMRANSRCLRMSSTSQTVPKQLCEARLELEIAKLQNILDAMDYTDTMNDKIKQTLREADKLNGNEQAEAKKTKLAEVSTMQNVLRNELISRTKTFGQYDQQIAALKSQQAEFARIALQGKPPGLLGAVASAVIMKSVFKAYEH